MGTDNEVEPILIEIRVLREKNRVKRAGRVLRKSLSGELSDEERVKLGLELVDMLWSMNKYQQAISKAEEFIAHANGRDLRLNWEMSYLYIKLADAAIEEGGIASYFDPRREEELLNKAKDAIDKAIAIAPTNDTEFEAYRALGDYHSCLMEYVDSKDAFEKAREYATDNQQNATILARLARLETQTGDYSLAIKHYEEAHSLVDDTSSFNLAHHYFNLGNAHSELGHIDESIEYYVNAIDLVSKNMNRKAIILKEMCHYGLGHRYLAISDYEKARDQFYCSYRLDKKAGDNPFDSLMMLGETYCWMSEYYKALKYLQKARRLASDNVEDIERIEKDIEICERNLFGV